MPDPLIKISQFQSFYSKKRGEYLPGGRPSETDFYTEMRRIKDGYYADIINELRQLVSDDQQKLFKRSRLPSFTTSALIKDWRDEKNIVQHSRLLNIDIDSSENQHISDWNELRDKLVAQIPMVAAFLSARQNGLSFVIKIDPGQHQQTYEYVAWELHRTFGIFVDTSCKNLTRLRFVSHDPNAYINFDFDSLPEIVPTPQYLNSVKQKPPLSLLTVTAVNSRELFENACRAAERDYQFVDGSKYWYLIKVAGYCNSHGMTRDYCERLVTEKFGPLTTADVLAPIGDIYQRYQHQFGTISFAKSELASLRQRLLIDVYETLPPPPTVLEIDDTRFCTLGNFSMVIGKAKSRKTFFVSMVAAAFLKGLPFQTKFQRKFVTDKRKLLLFDTEQGHYDVQLLTKKILTMVEIDSCDALEVYHLRTIDTKKRLEFIEDTIYNTPELCFCIIDGVRDLVFDINSPEEATHVAGKLLKWTEELNIHCLTVLHQNKADTNGRGHLGTELTNKAESVLSITRDQKQPEISVVVPEYFRGKEFQSFAFRVNETGTPVITDEPVQPVDDNGKVSLNANNVPESQHLLALRECFKHQPNPQYRELITQLRLYFQQFGVSIGDNKAKDFIAYYVNKKWLQKTTSERYPRYELM